MRSNGSPLVVDMSQRDRPHIGFDLNGNIIESTEEDANWWKEKKYLKGDFAVRIGNASNETVIVPRESTPAGFYDLTFVVYGRDKEYILAKKPGLWYSVSQSYHVIKPGESIVVPVALSPYFWQNATAVLHEAKELFAIRGQFTVVHDYATDVETVNSSTYSLSKLLPGKGFMDVPVGIKLTEPMCTASEGEREKETSRDTPRGDTLPIE